MNVDYEKLREFSTESVLANGNSLPCYYLIHNGVERYLIGETISDDYLRFLLKVGVLVNDSEERKNIVEPFNFMGNDRPQTN